MTRIVFPSDQDRADNEELDRVCVMLEEALEREQALAAHVERCSKFAGYIGLNTGESKLADMLAHGPYKYHLNRRDLIKQAEALERTINVMQQPMMDGGHPWLVRVEDIQAMADDLRTQAKGVGQ